MIAELSSPELSTRRRHALLSDLSKVGTDRSVAVLRMNLRCRDVRSQVAAVFALAHVATPRAVEALIECLEMEPGPRLTIAT